MSNQLAVIGAQDILNEKDVEILRNSKFKGFEPHEIEHCSKICTQLQLSPFLNQIHFVKRKNKDGSYSIASQVGIDGFRLAAQRSGAYAGSDEPVYDYGTDKKKPAKASVAVYKMVQGQRCPFTGTARWEEYFPGPPNDRMWNQMPHNQLAKCAEALALRKGFPAELSSIYLNEEMDQANRQPDKASAVMSAIKPQEPKEVSAEVSDPPQKPEGEGMPPCSHCKGSSVMWSRFHENAIYCKDCKKTNV